MGSSTTLQLTIIWESVFIYYMSKYLIVFFNSETKIDSNFLKVLISTPTSLFLKVSRSMSILGNSSSTAFDAP